MQSFMMGRYGADEFAKFTMGIALVFIVLSIFIRSGVLDLMGMAAIVYTYFRMFSRNISKRYQENQKYLSKTATLRSRFQKEKRMMEQRKTHHIYTCPGCSQKIRIPKGKGKKVALLDLGAKKNIARSLNQRGCEVTIYPALTTAEEILADMFK